MQVPGIQGKPLRSRSDFGIVVFIIIIIITVSVAQPKISASIAYTDIEKNFMRTLGLSRRD